MKKKDTQWEKNKIIQQVESIKPTIFLTLNFNKVYNDKAICLQSLRFFDAKINRKLLGKNWQSPLKKHERILSINILEEGLVQEMTHFHCFISLPFQQHILLPKFCMYAKPIWEKITGVKGETKKGSVDIEMIYDTIQASNYCTKQIFKKDELATPKVISSASFTN